MKKRERKIFKKIEDIRKKNNKNWMDLLRLSRSKLKETLIILSQIIQKDQSLVKLAKSLKKRNKKQ